MSEAKQEKPWLDFHEIMDIFGCSRAKAYKILKTLNDELEAKGYLIIPGKVSRKYFRERYYG